jgi:hypothetical protein
MEIIRRSWPLGLVTFPWMESNQRSSQQRGFFSRAAFALQIRQNRGWKQLPRLVRFWPAHLLLVGPSANISYALPPHLACIVLPDFGRSFSADGSMCRCFVMVWVKLTLGLLTISDM